jgi:transposase
MLLVAADIAMSDFTHFNGSKGGLVKNADEPIESFLGTLPKGTVIALEPTARYSDLLATKAYNAGFTVYMVQPTWIRAHRRSKRTRAKTDKIDAKLIYEYVLENAHNLHPWRPLPVQLEQLKELVRQRQSLADDLARMRQTYKALNMDAAIRHAILAPIQKAKALLDKRIAKTLEQIPQARFLLSIKGVGPLIAATLIVPLLHLEFKGPDSFIGFIGIDPVPQDSGDKQGIRRISKKGDVYLRRALYMAAFCSTRFEPWKPRYKALKAKGLKPKQALIALAKKIATTAFHLVKLQVEFDPKMLATRN